MTEVGKEMRSSVKFYAADRRISSTPTEELDSATYEYAVLDGDGDDSGSAMTNVGDDRERQRCQRMTEHRQE